MAVIYSDIHITCLTGWRSRIYFGPHKKANVKLRGRGKERERERQIQSACECSSYEYERWNDTAAATEQWPTIFFKRKKKRKKRIVPGAPTILLHIFNSNLPHVNNSK